MNIPSLFKIFQASIQMDFGSALINTDTRMTLSCLTDANLTWFRQIKYTPRIDSLHFSCYNILKGDFLFLNCLQFFIDNPPLDLWIRSRFVSNFSFEFCMLKNNWFPLDPVWQPSSLSNLRIMREKPQRCKCDHETMTQIPASLFHKSWARKTSLDSGLDEEVNYLVMRVYLTSGT